MYGFVDKLPESSVLCLEIIEFSQQVFNFAAKIKAFSYNYLHGTFLLWGNI